MLMNCCTNRWLKECKRLFIFNYNYNEKIRSLLVDGSLVRFTLNLSNQTS
jgi:hypothetical protein